MNRSVRPADSLLPVELERHAHRTEIGFGSFRELLVLILTSSPFRARRGQQKRHHSECNRPVPRTQNCHPSENLNWLAYRRRACSIHSSRTRFRDRS
jgi:hypothetical protein